MFRKNLNFRNIRQLQIFLRNTDFKYCISRPNLILTTSVSCPNYRFFGNAALPKYNHNETKENIDVESLNTATLLEDVDKAFIEMDYAVKRTGRVSKSSVENIVTMIERLNSASDVHGLYLLRCCGLMHMEKPSERVKLANMIFLKLHKLSVQLDVKHFNSLLKVFVDCDHQFLPTEFLASMDSSNIEPNKATYLLLLEKYCNVGDLSGAGEILQCLKDKGLPINESVFNILIKGHMRSNDISGAEDILEVMRSSNLSPSAESYEALACGFAEKGNVDGVNSVLNAVKVNNIVFSNKHYLNIIASWSDTDNMNVIDKLLEKIVDVHDWRNEIANVMMGLMFKGGKERDGIAFKLLLKIANTENNFANSFMRILLKCDRPKDSIIQYCEEISDRKLHNKVFMNAAKAAIDLGKLELSLTFFEALQKKGVPMRRSNLNLLLSSFNDNEEGIWLTLKKMFELGVPADFFTYLHYVFPAVSVSDPETVLSKIQETGHSSILAIESLFEFYCYSSAFDNALYLMEKYPVKLHPSFCFETYIKACKDTKNYSKPCLKVLHYLIQNIGAPAQDPEVAQGRNLATLIELNHSLYEALIKSPNEKIQFSRKSYNICSDTLWRSNPEALRHLRRLGNFKNQSSEKKISGSIINEEEELKFLKEKGLPTERFLLHCLAAHLKQKNIARINQLTEELDKQRAQYPPTLLTQLLTFYCQNNDIEKAEKFFNVLKRECPTFILDSLKVIDYATLLIKCSRFDDAVNFITAELQEIHLFGHSETTFRKSVTNLLNVAIEFGNIDFIRTLQDVLSSHTEILEANVFYEALVKMHIYKNDLDSAIDEFEKCVKNHRVAPGLKRIMAKCVVTENPSKLEIVMKTASNLIGKEAVFYELAVTFLETGRRSEAKKLMENLKNKPYTSYLEDICSQMYYQNRVVGLLEIINLLYAVNHIDRQKILHYVFELISKKNDLKTAENLYNSVLKSFEPNGELKELFLNFLSKNKKVHFTDSENSVSSFLQSVKENDAQQALKTFQSMKKGIVRTLEFGYMANFLDLLLKNKILSDFSQNSNAMSYVIENATEILKPLIEKYSCSGDTDSLHEVAKFFPDSALKKCSFNNYLSRGYIQKDGHEDLLLELENHLDKKNNLFSVSSFVELLKKPDLEYKAVNLAKKYLEINFDLPIAAVWAHYLIDGRHEEAESIYKLYSVPADKVNNLILRTVRQQENITLGMTYISIINSIDVQKRCKERTYGTVLDVLVSKEMYDDAATLVVEAQAKDINLEKYYKSSLKTLKGAFEREKKNIPFSTPAEGYATSE